MNRIPDMFSLLKRQLSIRHLLIQVPVPDIPGTAPFQNIGNNIDAKGLIDIAYGPEYKHGHISNIHPCPCIFTRRTVSARIFRCFPEIRKDGISKTSRRTAVINHLVQTAILNIQLLCRQIALRQQVLLNPCVPGTVQQDAFGSGSIPSSSSGFLIIGFQALRHLIMNYIPYIALIDTHTKRIGGHHNLQTVKREIILCLFSFLLTKAGMIPPRLYFMGSEKGINGIYRLPGCTINNTAFLFMGLYIP